MTPLLALAAPRGSSARAVPLLRLLGVGVDVVSYRFHQRLEDREPDAILCTSVTALHVLPAVPTAVWVDTIDELTIAGRLEHVVARLSSHPELVDAGAVLVPRSGVDVSRWPPLAPLVRGRWRERYDLPADLVVGVDPPLDEVRPEASLALAAAAIVVGEPTALALALGTPIVTSAANAKRFGLRPGVEAEVAAGPAAAAALAREVAADDVRAARLSRRGRRFAESHLDLGAPARELQVSLGLAEPPSPSLADPIAARLDELGTPDHSYLRGRLAAALSLFPTSPGGSR